MSAPDVARHSGQSRPPTGPSNEPKPGPHPPPGVVVQRNTAATIEKTKAQQRAAGSVLAAASCLFPFGKDEPAEPAPSDAPPPGSPGGGTQPSSADRPRGAAAADPWLESNLSKSGVDKTTLREMVNELRDYIIDSANSTGPDGITPLFLAAILSEEMANVGWTKLSNNRKARDSEIEGVERAIADRKKGREVDVGAIDRSVGIGQMRLSTLAQLEDVVPWIEDDPKDMLGQSRRDMIRSFADLSPSEQEGLLARLREPKSNVQAVAELLARLKNRSHRYPGMTRAAFGKDDRACQIVATEYNVGAKASSEADARPSDYGVRIRKKMSDEVLVHYFPND